MSVFNQIGIIDLGTNSLKGFVFKVNGKRRATLVSRYRELVRLGDDVFLHGSITPGAYKRTISAVETILQSFNRDGVSSLVFVGTSALRTARNSGRLIRTVKRRFGVSLRKLSDKDEALLIGRGVNFLEPPIKGYTLTVDIGGGSVELILSRGRRILKSASFTLGAASVQQRFLKSVPPAPGHTDQLRSFIRRTLRQSNFPRDTKIDRALGSSGSVRTLCRAITTMDHSPLHIDELGAFIAKIAGASKKTIARIPRIEKKRADLILGAAIVLEEIMAHFGIETIKQTRYALKDGIIAEVLQKPKQSARSLIRSEKMPVVK